MKKLIQKIKLKFRLSFFGKCHVRKEDNECPLNDKLQCKYKDICEVEEKVYRYRILFLHDNGVYDKTEVLRSNYVESIIDELDIARTISKENNMKDVVILGIIRLE